MEASIEVAYGSFHGSDELFFHVSRGSFCTAAMEAPMHSMEASIQSFHVFPWKLSSIVLQRPNIILCKIGPVQTHSLSGARSAYRVPYRALSGELLTPTGSDRTYEPCR